MTELKFKNAYAKACHSSKFPNVLEKIKQRYRRRLNYIAMQKNGFTKIEEFCPKLSKYPFVCNTCSKRSNAGCSYLMKIYSARRLNKNIEGFNILQPLEIIAMYDNCYFQTVFRGNQFSSKFACYTSEKIYNDSIERLSNRSPLSQNTFLVVSIANMNFYEITETEERIIWIDNISEMGIYYCPYLDKEWYLDQECNVLWDKNYSMPDNREKLNVFCKQSGGEHD